MIIHTFESLLPTPWKNGGGITREITKQEDDGYLLWRLSIADVASDGPFSIFTGLSRILTVIDGGGLELNAPHGQLMALPLQPVSFSGDWPIESRRLAWDVRDFNVIFDATRVKADVRVHAAPTDLMLPPLPHSCRCLLFLGNGHANGVPVPQGACVILESETVHAKANAAIITATLSMIV